MFKKKKEASPKNLKKCICVTNLDPTNVEFSSVNKFPLLD